MQLPPALDALSVVWLQAGPNVDVAPVTGVAGGAIGAFLTTLVVGAIMIAVVPEYTEAMMEKVLDAPVGSFVYGIVTLVVLFIVALILIITVIGILVAIPLLVVAYVLWAVGAVIAYLAIAERLIGRSDGWLKPLLLAAGINGLLTVTGIGALVAFGIGAIGFGAVLRSKMG